MVKVLRIQQPDLPQCGCVIPIDSLTRQFISTKLHDHDKVQLYSPISRRHIRQKPVHLLTMRETEVQLIN
jgi:hypothetical protein